MESFQTEYQPVLPSPDDVLQRKFVARANCGVALILASNVITNAPDNLTGIRVDEKSIIPLLTTVEDKFAQELPSDRHSIKESSVADTYREIRELFEPTLDYFTESGIVPAAIASEVRKKLFMQKSIDVNEGEDVHYAYGSFEFSDKWIAGFVLGTKAARNFANTITDAATSQGYTLSPEIAQRCALITMISHEYGHAAEDGLIITQNTPPNNETTRTWEEGNRSGKEIQTKLREELYRDIAPDIRIAQLFPDNTDRYESGMERVATGFEVVGLTHALELSGVLPDTAVHITQAYVEKMHQGVSDLQYIRSIAEAADISYEKLSIGLTAVRSEMYKNNRADLEGSLPRYGFSGKQLGYYLPLQQDQLARYFRLSPSSNRSIA